MRTIRVWSLKVNRRSRIRQPFVSGVFGDIFDVLTAGRSGFEIEVQTLPSYRAVVVGGRIEWSMSGSQRLNDYVRNGGTS